MDIKMFGALSDAFGPSGFEEEVVKVIGRYTKDFAVSSDAMHNVYAKLPGNQEGRPVVQLDAHSDECSFMVQCIHDNGALGIIMLGGMQLVNLPAHTVLIRNHEGRLIRGIIMSKPVHFLTEQERASQALSIETIYVDVGATSRREVEEAYGIAIGDPMVPEVKFAYDEKQGVCFGKAFDNRAGCACIIDTLQQLKDEKQLAVNVVGAFAAQEEVGMRGATVTAQVVKPDLCILFEGSPSDDFFFGVGQAQGRMKQGVQIRRLDKSYISNPVFIDFAKDLAKKNGIKFQETVRRGGSTNAGKISLTGRAVPVLVLGVPSRYVHTHYNFCAKEDLEAASALAVEVIKNFDAANLKHILRQDILENG